MHTLYKAPAGLARRTLSLPPARVLVLGLILLLMMGLNADVMTSYAEKPVKAVQHIIAMAIAGFGVYIGYAHSIEQRAASELALPGMSRELGIGLLIGAGLYILCELVPMALGIYRINGLNPLSYLIPAIAMALSPSIFEELLFRSVETWFGSWAVLVVSSLVFGKKRSFCLLFFGTGCLGVSCPSRMTQILLLEVMFLDFHMAFCLGIKPIFYIVFIDRTPCGQLA